MNELFSLGLILLLALVAGHLVKFLRVPEVTGYILAGVALGPSGLHWLSHQHLGALEIFSEVALGLILFSIGTVFELDRFRATGRRTILLTGVEATLTGSLVVTGMLAMGSSWPVALLLGAIATETAAASTLMVLRECRATGPFNDTLLGIVAVNNIICLAAFSIVATVLDVSTGLGATEAAVLIFNSVFTFIWQMLGGVALGFLVGLMLASWATRITEHGELLILLIGAILLCVGAARILDISPLIASLAVGATMVNFSQRSRRLFSVISRTDPPLYAIFFVIAGADLDLNLLGKLGALGVVYIAARSLGKLGGGWLGARWLGMESGIQRNLGSALLSQAGLAIGLTLGIGSRYPEYGPTVAAVVLGAVIVFELVGPISTRFAVLRESACTV